MTSAGRTLATTPSPKFPATRYQGSKYRLADAIVHATSDLDFTTVLDAFSGTASVGYAFKRAGKSVTCNDLLRFNHQIALALVENNGVRLAHGEIERIAQGADCPPTVEAHFDGIYFTRDENRWLDRAAAAIRLIECRFRRAIAWYALFQSAMAKRPYNLFHRANLYMRTADVRRSFGNKASWDRPFPDHFRKFVTDANAAILDGRTTCRAIRGEVLSAPVGLDLVYADPPYVNAHGQGVDYRDFYHFLEGLMLGERWVEAIDFDSRHRRLVREENSWCSARSNTAAFASFIERFAASHLVISYRDDGNPTAETIADLVCRHKDNVKLVRLSRQQYALSNKRDSHEMLVIGTDDTCC